jgi:hypothetical protein
MSRLTRFGWFLAALLVVTVVLALISPGIAIIPAAILVLALLGALAEGIVGFGGPGVTLIDSGDFTSHKREALRRRYQRGRPDWETTPPDFADESQDAIFERERKRRGLG